MCDAEPFPRHWEGTLVTREDCRIEARAAIAAMREATKKMIDAGDNEATDAMDSGTDSGGSYSWLPSGSCTAIFRAMIDEALK